MLKQSIAILGAAFMLAASATVSAADGCRVHDPELRIAFSGDCNRDGYAEGLGAAKGSAEYVGEFKAGHKHGRGVKVWPWGDRYVGDFVEDKKEGRGVYLWGAQAANAGDSYLGDYKNDRRHGQGSYQWASGERYEGTWENDLMTGPPTAMAIQRGRHQAALRAAVVKKGATICRELDIGIGAKERIRGLVINADPDRMTIEVQVDRAVPVLVAGTTVAAGGSFWDKAQSWEPCP